MPEAEVLATGEGEDRLHDSDPLRSWRRDRKRRDHGRVIGEMGIKPRVTAPIERLPPPSAREIEILRHQSDPACSVMGRTAKS
jgi:hypothetical protein